MLAASSSFSFPEGFAWGAAAAAGQIEGAATEDGKGESIWDRFAATPGKVKNGDTPAVACDHYHRYEADAALMRQLGITPLSPLGRLAPDFSPGRRPGQSQGTRLLRPADRLLARPRRDPLGHALSLGPSPGP